MLLNCIVVFFPFGLNYGFLIVVTDVYKYFKVEHCSDSIGPRHRRRCL